MEGLFERDMFLYCSQSGGNMTKAIYVPWDLLKQDEKENVKLLVEEASQGIIDEKSVKPLKLPKTVKPLLDFWENVVNESIETSWMNASFRFDEDELSLKHGLPEPNRIYELLLRTGSGKICCSILYLH